MSLLMLILAVILCIVALWALFFGPKWQAKRNRPYKYLETAEVRRLYEKAVEKHESNFGYRGLQTGTRETINEIKFELDMRTKEK